MGLGVSAAALSGLVHLQSVWAHADDAAEITDTADAADTVDAANSVGAADVVSSVDAVEIAAVTVEAEPEVADAPAAADGEGAPTLVAATSPAKPISDIEPAAPEGPALITVPDLSGMKVGLAVKTLRGLGLRVSIQDEYGDRVYVEEWQAYKVRKQRIEPGTKVEAGSRVRLDAKYRRRFAKGY